MRCGARPKALLCFLACFSERFWAFSFMSCCLMSQSKGAALTQLSRTPVKSRGSFQKGFVKVVMVCAHLSRYCSCRCLVLTFSCNPVLGSSSGMSTSGLWLVACGLACKYYMQAEAFDGPETKAPLRSVSHEISPRPNPKARSLHEPALRPQRNCGQAPASNQHRGATRATHRAESSD